MRSGTMSGTGVLVYRWRIDLIEASSPDGGNDIVVRTSLPANMTDVRSNNRAGMGINIYGN